MEVNYGKSAPFSLGIEEELQLLSPDHHGPACTRRRIIPQEACAGMALTGRKNAKAGRSACACAQLAGMATAANAPGSHVRVAVRVEGF